MKFSIFTHVPHTQKKNCFYGYAPYIREMNLWLKYVDEAKIIAPLVSEEVSAAEISYKKEYLKFIPVPELNFSGLGKILSFFSLPIVAIRIFKEMLKSDHLHLRCPGNIGLISCFMQILFPWKEKSAKYAGNWDPKAKQPWTYKLQKWILGNTFLTRNMKVLVYGEWPNQSKNIKPFFTASFSEKEISEVPIKQFNPPYLFLFAGNLVPGKRPLLAIKIVEILKRKGFPVQMEFFGEGILRQDLENYVQVNKISEIVSFKGNQELEKVKEAYKKAHFLILPSKSEGWPKAVAEAMFFGCIPIATAVSCVPWMLGYGARGVLLEQGDGALERPNDEVKTQVDDNVAEQIINLLESPEEMKRKSFATQEWSQQYTLERFEKGIQVVLNREKDKRE